MLPAPPGLARIPDLDAAWERRHHGDQLREIRRAAEGLRERFAGGPRCLSLRTLPLTTLPYPTAFAFHGMTTHPAPFVTLAHRCLLVQFLQAGEPRTLLFNPTDLEGARAAPYARRLAARFGRRIADALVRPSRPLEEQLGALGLATGDVDYVAFDHFHLQDLRRLLGVTGSDAAPRFPNAVLIAPRVEWEDWDDLHPLQRPWFVPDGKRGVRTDRIVLTDGDIALGDGVMLVGTPGHTLGNQTLFVNTDSGVWGTSENGTSADAWSPLESNIRGLRAAARLLDREVVLNANTAELAARQYTSMILERTIVDRVKRAPGFAQMFPSSEIHPSVIAPGLAPTLIHKAISSGEIVRPARGRRREAA
jgi:glyoxylase-like metal-dependent hydrolase (beta-lactamase superfamily II)